MKTNPGQSLVIQKVSRDTELAGGLLEFGGKTEG